MLAYQEKQTVVLDVTTQRNATTNQWLEIKRHADAPKQSQFLAQARKFWNHIHRLSRTIQWIFQNAEFRTLTS